MARPKVPPDAAGVRNRDFALNTNGMIRLGAIVFLRDHGAELDQLVIREIERVGGFVNIGLPALMCGDAC